MSNYNYNQYMQRVNKINSYFQYPNNHMNYYSNDFKNQNDRIYSKNKRNDIYNIYNSNINSINININTISLDKKKTFLQDEILSPYNEDNRRYLPSSNYYYDDSTYYNKSNLNLNRYYQSRTNSSNNKVKSKSKVKVHDNSKSKNSFYNSNTNYASPKKVISIDEYKNIDHNKKMLILDLDETLVHSSLKPIQYNNQVIQPDIFLKVKFHSNYFNVYVLKRPFVDEFLEAMNKIYNIIIFTASVQEYADPLLNQLDKNKVIKLRYYRNSCTTNQNGKFVKDLSTLYKDLNNIILLDNNPISYSYNKSNGLPIITWYSDKKDKELYKIIPVLQFLSKVKDVRNYIPRFIELEMVNYNKFNLLLNEMNKENEQSDSPSTKGASTETW